MFVVEALYPFSSIVLKQQQKQADQQQNSEENLQKYSLRNSEQVEQKLNINKNENQQNLQQAIHQADTKQGSSLPNQSSQNSQISYLTFQKGDKILVLQSFQNGWWYGNTIKQPQIKGFFPSNYVQVSAKPKPPPPPSEPLPSEYSQNQVEDPNEEKGADWVQNQLSKITQGPVKSDYYLGIKGYKNVKIDDKNQNILKGDHVKFDVSTGLAKVPVKDQAPVAKAVRQMGYYFDYHQWIQERNKHPGYRARPDPKKKKIKKLNLKGMK